MSGVELLPGTSFEIVVQRTGTQGVQGDAGPAGATGPAGPQGEQGPQGETGDITPEAEAALEAVNEIWDDLTAAPTTIGDPTYTVVEDDLGKTLRFTAACVVTLPATLDAGWWCVLRRVGSGAVSWAAGSGATIHADGTEIAAQWKSVAATVDNNADALSGVWVVEGAIL